jgi:hypothetical protein
VTAITHPPCDITVAADDPAYVPCDDCQTMRVISESPQCERVPQMITPRLPAPSDEIDAATFGRFAGWLMAGGRRGNSAREIVSKAKKAIEGGAVMPDDVTSERFPDRAKATLDGMRSALTLWGKFKRGEKSAKREVSTSDAETVEYPPHAPTIEVDPEEVQEQHQALVDAHLEEVAIVEAEDATPDPQAPAEVDVATRCNDDATLHPTVETAATTSTVIVPAECAPVPDLFPAPVIDPDVQLDEPTILLPIPVSWIDSVSYNRDGCEAWMGFEEPLRVSDEMAFRIVRLMRERSR